MSRLLIIEDNPDIAELYGMIFSDQETVLIEDVPPALSFLSRHRPDLLITDFHLPNGTGVDIISHVRRHSGLHDVPILGVSVDDTQREELLEHGADAFLTKPLDIPQLLEMAQHLLTNPHQRQVFTPINPEAVLAEYVEAYEAAYHRRPACYWTGRHFLIDKQRCDQNWLRSETERLRTVITKQTTPRRSLLRLIDKLRRI